MMKLISILAMIVLGAGSAIVLIVYSDTISRIWTSTTPDEVVVYVDNHAFNVTIADSPEEWQRGLSGTERLPEFHGKLFVFDTDDTHGIWMKDMRYPLDILWFDTNRRLVHVQADATPDSYTNSRTIFRPNMPTRFVLEINAGMVELLGISNGATLTLPANLLE